MLFLIEIKVEAGNRHIHITRDDYSEFACGINGWCLLSKTVSLDFLNVLEAFLFVAVLVTGLTYMHVGSRFGA